MDHQASALMQIPFGMYILDLSSVELHAHNQGQPVATEIAIKMTTYDA